MVLPAQGTLEVDFLGFLRQGAQIQMGENKFMFDQKSQSHVLGAS